jgi:hypothetical protein
MTDVAVTEVLGESLSPSQVNMYMMCPAKWYFRYLIGLSEPTTGALALGKAFHGTLARNFRQKLNTGHDMETRELSEVFSAEWSLASADAALPDDEDAEELAATGQILVSAYGRSCYSFATVGNRTDRSRRDCRRQSARDRRSAGH